MSYNGLGFTETLDFKQNYSPDCRFVAAISALVMECTNL
jgi:hypothetical protein